jgi:hypothetical protein
MHINRWQFNPNPGENMNMKKTLFGLIALSCISTPCFADEDEADNYLQCVVKLSAKGASGAVIHETLKLIQPIPYEGDTVLDEIRASIRFQATLEMNQRNIHLSIQPVSASNPGLPLGPSAKAWGSFYFESTVRTALQTDGQLGESTLRGNPIQSADMKCSIATDEVLPTPNP